MFFKGLFLRVKKLLSSATTFNMAWSKFPSGIELKTFAGQSRNLETNLTYSRTKPPSSVGSVADLIIGGRWFDPRLDQYSVLGLKIVIATGFIPLSVVSTMIMWKSSQWLGKNIVLSTG